MKGKKMLLHICGNIFLYDRKKITFFEKNEKTY